MNEEKNHQGWSNRKPFDLIDLSRYAAEAGFRLPVAITTAAWEESVALADDSDYEDEIGRLWDLLNGLSNTIRHLKLDVDPFELRFTVFVRTGEVTSEEINLIALCDSGVDGEPVITIMLPHED